jgi:hypothetical protein
MNLTGKSLTDTIINLLKRAILDIAFLYGQGYDGGTIMSGTFRGIQARIMNMLPLAIYTHCANHRLNLALSKASTVTSIHSTVLALLKAKFSKASTVPSIHSTVRIITNINKFLRESASRTQLLNTKIRELLSSQKTVNAEKFCRTRRVEKHDRILHLFGNSACSNLCTG